MPRGDKPAASRVEHMKTHFFVVLVAAFLVSPPCALAQTTWIVDLGGGGDFTNIQDCIDTAVDGDTCLVNQGIFVENIDFVGKNMTVKSNSGPDVTVIDGDATGAVVTFQNGETGNAVIDGFTITNGSDSGIDCQGSYPTIRSCVISGNTTSGSGGGINFMNIFTSGHPTVESCVISGNTATTSGGGMDILFCSPKITNTTITDNSAGVNGGGVHGRDCGPRFTNCTISNNSSGYAGGGLFFFMNFTIGVANCILWQNTSPRGPEIGLEGVWSMEGSLNASYSDIQGGEAAIYHSNAIINWGSGNIDADPLFVGGADYQLQDGSPCLDVGDNAAPEIPVVDIDGDNRVVDGNCDSLAIVDMGSDEFTKSCGYLAVASAEAATLGPGSVTGSGISNELILLFVPAGAILLLRIVRRKK